VFWHYYNLEQDGAVFKVWDDPFYPVPGYIEQGYECICGATPS
jgi:hypothetical protein